MGTGCDPSAAQRFFGGSKWRRSSVSITNETGGPASGNLFRVMPFGNAIAGGFVWRTVSLVLHGPSDLTMHPTGATVN